MQAAREAMVNAAKYAPDAAISLYSDRIGLSGEAWIWSLINGAFSMTIVCLLFAFAHPVHERRVGERRVICGLSGGVDSAVAAVRHASR